MPRPTHPVGPRNGFERRSLAKRMQILNAATQLFLERGLPNVTVAMVAQAASVSQVTVFKYFGDKAGLIRDVIKRRLDERVAEYEHVLRGDTPYDERCRQFLAIKLCSVRDVESGLLATLVEDYPELARELHATRRALFERLSRPFLAEGRDRGLLSRAIPDDVVWLALEIWQRGLEHTPEAVRFLTKKPDAARSLLEWFLHGLLTNVSAMPAPVTDTHASTPSRARRARSRSRLT